VKVLVLNAGSSSIKYELFDMTHRRALASGLLERIGERESRLTHQQRAAGGATPEIERKGPVADHREGFGWIGEALRESGTVRESGELYGVGHRIVHGGEVFQEPTLIDDRVMERIREQIPLAPLHNPANLAGIEVAVARLPDVPHVAVFDTAFHHSIPAHAYHYALPYEFYTTHHVRRYGFHGTSHLYVAKQAARHLRRPLEALNLIVLHLGNGASITAIQNGRSIDTSMGLTPLEGLIMGTRSGDIDPAIVFFLARVTGRSNDELESLLNKESGLKGICGANDMREILRRACEGDARADLAIEMYVYRLKKYIGAYYAALGRVDGIAFTAGIGENAAEIRARACDGLSGLGIDLDPRKNAARSQDIREIQAQGASVKVMVIPTDEELEIADETVECIQRSR
jgi:acetate kinase